MIKSPISGCTAGSRDNPQLFGNKRKTGIKIPRIPAPSTARRRIQPFPRRRTLEPFSLPGTRYCDVPLTRRWMEHLNSGIARLRRFFLTPCLQPQMKTYRCPWCVSRTNHNILYFGGISRTSSLNTAICLWKVRNSSVRRGSARFKLPQFWGTRWVGQRLPPHRLTLAPVGLRHKAQNRCTSAAILFKLWTFGSDEAALASKVQSATWPEASAGGARGRYEFLRSQCDKTQHVFHARTGVSLD